MKKVFEARLTVTKLVSMLEVRGLKPEITVERKIYWRRSPGADLRYELRQRQTIEITKP